jgi:hypothetical protein
MAFDTLNFALIGFAILLLAIAVFRSARFQASLPPPLNPIGFGT